MPPSETWHYVDIFTFKNGNLFSINIPECRLIKNASGVWEKEFNYSDHLGNSRVSFKAENGNLVQTAKTDFDPIGVVLRSSVTNSVANRFELQGHEKEMTFGLNRVNFGARTLNPTIGVFDRTDRFSEKYYSLSPVQFSAGNPISLIDVNGDSLSNPSAWVQLTFGIVGVIGSGAYMYGSGGLGAVAGGSTAMAFSFGEIALAMKELDNKNPNYSNPSTLLGAYSESEGGSKNQIATADAVGGLLPGGFTGGNIKGTINSLETILGPGSAGEKIYSSISAADGVADILAPINLLSNEMRDNPNRKRDYSSLDSNNQASPVVKHFINNSWTESTPRTLLSTKQINAISNFLNKIPK